MNYRVDRTNDFMRFIMTPPVQPDYATNDIKVDTVKVIDKNSRVGGLGELPILSGGGDQNSWVMPVVVIVVSAMALMTLYAVLSKR